MTAPMPPELRCLLHAADQAAVKLSRSNDAGPLLLSDRLQVLSRAVRALYGSATDEDQRLFGAYLVALKAAGNRRVKIKRAKKDAVTK